MIEQICAFIHNYFTDASTRQAGIWRITDGNLVLPFMKVGQYFRITGSDVNDGVYQYPAEELTDEVFYGTVWPMRVPRMFLQLVEEIESWQEKYGAAAASPYQSESFGGYSYTLKSGSNASGGTDSAAAGWQGVYKSRLNQWRKLA